MLANALAVPITGFWIMPWAIISVLLMPLGLEAGPLALMGAGIHLIASVAFTVTALPGAVVTLPSMPAWSLLAMALGGLWLCIWRQPWRWLGAAPLTLGYVALVLMRPPDLLIADNGRAVAVLAADGTYLPSDAAAARGLEAAVRRVGSAFGPAWPEDGVAAQGMLRCDAEACLYRARGRLVALERGGDALAEDCRSADLVVSPVASHRACRGPPIIDRIDDWRLGGHAVWLDAAGIRIETVRAWQGTRPWVPRRALSSAASTRRAGPAP